MVRQVSPDCTGAAASLPPPTPAMSARGCPVPAHLDPVPSLAQDLGRLLQASTQGQGVREAELLLAIAALELEAGLAGGVLDLAAGFGEGFGAVGGDGDVAGEADVGVAVGQLLLLVGGGRGRGCAA